MSGTTGATTYGIHCESSSANLILQNTCVGQTTNYVIGANDTYGPIVTNSGALATTNGAAAMSPAEPVFGCHHAAVPTACARAGWAGLGGAPAKTPVFTG